MPRRTLKTLLFVVLLVIFTFVFTTTAYGAEYEYSTVAENTVYYESSENFGSGRHNTVTKDNPYITDSREVIINGYSFLGENGEILSSFYNGEAKEDIVIPEAPKTATKCMVHIHSKTNRLGWIDGELVHFPLRTTQEEEATNLPEEKTTELSQPEQLVDDINQNQGKTLILLDKSSSMDTFIEEETSAFNNLQLEEGSITIMAFNTKVYETNQEEVNSPCSGKTNIYKALNQAKDFDNVVLISDLDDTMFFKTKLKELDNVKSLQIFCPTDKYVDLICSAVSEKWANTKVQVNIIELEEATNE